MAKLLLSLLLVLYTASVYSAEVVIVGFDNELPCLTCDDNPNADDSGSDWSKPQSWQHSVAIGPACHYWVELTVCYRYTPSTFHLARAPPAE